MFLLQRAWPRVRIGAISSGIPEGDSPSRERAAVAAWAGLEARGIDRGRLGEGARARCILGHMLWLVGIALVIFYVAQAAWRRTVVSNTERGRAHRDDLLLATEALAWGDTEILDRVRLSAEDPERYYREYGAAEGRRSDVWPWSVLCDELLAGGYAVRAADFDPPTYELSKRLDAMLARSGVHGFPWRRLEHLGYENSVESFLSELGEVLDARSQVLVHLNDGGQDLLVSILPREKFDEIDGITGPGNLYRIERWLSG